MKKSKGQTIDLLYENKNKVVKKQRSKTKNTTRKKKNNTKKTENNSNQRINLDNEIIIGLTPKKEQFKNKAKKKNKSKNSKSYKKNTKVKESKNNYKEKKKNKKSNVKKIDKKKQRKIKLLKWLLILILLILAITLFMMSSIFNIKEIVVINNNKISSEEIINLSTLKKDTNMFRITNKTIRDGVKTNAYIESVTVRRNLNGTVTLDIVERQATYMIRLENAYVYLNNQGYILEISEEALQVPVLVGFSTPEGQIKSGNRLNINDLNKLDDVNKIIKVSENSPLADIITEIDISNSNDYKLNVESEEKIVRLGNMSNINIKLQMAGNVFENEKGKKGEIYFQDDSKKAVFKEEVSR